MAEHATQVARLLLSGVNTTMTVVHVPVSAGATGPHVMHRDQVHSFKDEDDLTWQPLE
mgnify:CR=1 FL=1